VSGEICGSTAIPLKEYGFPLPIWRGDAAHETDPAHRRTRRRDREDPCYPYQEAKSYSHSEARVGA